MISLSGFLSPVRARRNLSVMRLAIGGMSYLAPRVAARAFAIDPDESAAMPSAVRLFGARELVTGIATMEPGVSRRWLALATVSDALDIVTVGLGVRAQRLNRATAVIGTVMASIAVVLGIAALRE